MSYFHIPFTQTQINLINSSFSQIPIGWRKGWRWTRICQEKSHPALKNIIHQGLACTLLYLSFRAASLNHSSKQIFRLVVPAHARRLCRRHHHPKVASPVHSNSCIAIYFKISLVFPFQTSHPPILRKQRSGAKRTQVPSQPCVSSAICIITVLCGFPPLQSRGFYISRERMILITERSGRQVEILSENPKQ